MENVGVHSLIITCVVSFHTCAQIKPVTALCQELILWKNASCNHFVNGSKTIVGTPTDEDIKIDIKRKEIAKIKKEIETLSKQLVRTHDLLEQGIYDVDMFLNRSRSINERMEAANNNITGLSRTLAEDEERAANRVNIIPKVEELLSVYDELPDAQSKNILLKDIIERIEYIKNKQSPRNGPYDNFELLVYPKLPIPTDK